MNKNTAGQKWTVFAFNKSTGEPVTGDAANITANLRIDDGTASAVADTNPTEQEDGYYVFDTTQSESNGNKLAIYPKSSTSGVQVIGCPAVIYTTPASFQSFVTPTGASVTASSVTDKTGYALSSAGVTSVQSGLSTLTAQQVWEYATRTLSSFGALVSDIATAVWGATTRTLSAFGFTVSRVTLVDTCTTNTDMRGTNNALLAANYTAPNNSGITDIKSKTDQLAFTTPNKVDATATVSTAGLATEANQILIRSDIAGVITHGDSAWVTGGGMSGSNAVTINVHDQNGINILDASVEIWDSVGTAFYEKKFSNSSGQAVFNMDSGTYTVKIHKAGYSFENTALTVTSAKSVTYVMTAYVIPTPADPSLCRVYTILRNGEGVFPTTAPSSELKIVTLPFKTNNSYYSEAKSGIYSSETGLMYWDIIRGASVMVTIIDYGIRIPLEVPDLELCEF